MIGLEETATAGRASVASGAMSHYEGIVEALPHCELNARVRNLMKDADRLADQIEDVLSELRPQSLARSRAPLAAFLRSFDTPDLSPPLTAALVTLRFAMSNIASTIPPVKPARTKGK